MLKHPVLASMGIAAVICLVVTGIWLTNARNVDEKPFILFFGMLGFPFVWFITWVIVNGISWGAEMKRGGKEES